MSADNTPVTDSLASDAGVRPFAPGAVAGIRTTIIGKLTQCKTALVNSAVNFTSQLRIVNPSAAERNQARRQLFDVMCPYGILINTPSGLRVVDDPIPNVPVLAVAQNMGRAAYAGAMFALQYYRASQGVRVLCSRLMTQEFAAACAAQIVGEDDDIINLLAKNGYHLGLFIAPAHLPDDEENVGNPRQFQPLPLDGRFFPHFYSYFMLRALITCAGLTIIDIGRIPTDEGPTYICTLVVTHLISRLLARCDEAQASLIRIIFVTVCTTFGIRTTGMFTERDHMDFVADTATEVALSDLWMLGVVLSAPTLSRVILCFQNFSQERSVIDYLGAAKVQALISALPREPPARGQMNFRPADGAVGLLMTAMLLVRFTRLGERLRNLFHRELPPFSRITIETLEKLPPAEPEVTLEAKTTRRVTVAGPGHVGANLMTATLSAEAAVNVCTAVACVEIDGIGQHVPTLLTSLDLFTTAVDTVEHLQRTIRALFPRVMFSTGKATISFKATEIANVYLRVLRVKHQGESVSMGVVKIHLTPTGASRMASASVNCHLVTAIANRAPPHDTLSIALLRSRQPVTSDVKWRHADSDCLATSCSTAPGNCGSPICHLNEIYAIHVAGQKTAGYFSNLAMLVPGGETPVISDANADILASANDVQLEGLVLEKLSESVVAERFRSAVKVNELKMSQYSLEVEGNLPEEDLTFFKRGDYVFALKGGYQITRAALILAASNKQAPRPDVVEKWCANIQKRVNDIRSWAVGQGHVEVKYRLANKTDDASNTITPFALLQRYPTDGTATEMSNKHMTFTDVVTIAEAIKLAVRGLESESERSIWLNWLRCFNDTMLKEIATIESHPTDFVQRINPKCEAIPLRKVLAGGTRAIVSSLAARIYMLSLSCWRHNEQLTAENVKTKRVINSVVSYHATWDDLMVSYCEQNSNAKYVFGLSVPEMYDRLHKAVATIDKQKIVSIDVSGWDRSLPMEAIAALYSAMFGVTNNNLALAINGGGRYRHGNVIFRVASKSKLAFVLWASGQLPTLCGNTLMNEALHDTLEVVNVLAAHGDDTFGSTELDDASIQAAYLTAGLTVKCIDRGEKSDFCAVHMVGEGHKIDAAKIVQKLLGHPLATTEPNRIDTLVSFTAMLPADHQLHKYVSKTLEREIPANARIPPSVRASGCNQLSPTLHGGAYILEKRTKTKASWRSYKENYVHLDQDQWARYQENERRIQYLIESENQDGGLSQNEYREIDARLYENHLLQKSKAQQEYYGRVWGYDNDDLQEMYYDHVWNSSKQQQSQFTKAQRAGDFS